MPENESKFVLSFCHNYACKGNFSLKRVNCKVLDCGLFWNTLFVDAYFFYKSCGKLPMVSI